jgi:hypothetical protein
VGGNSGRPRTAGGHQIVLTVYYGGREIEVNLPRMQWICFAERPEVMLPPEPATLAPSLLPTSHGTLVV